LAELTKNQTYTDAAVLSAQFIQNHLVLPSGLLADNINIGTCVVDHTTWTIDSAFALHGWSVLADVTGDMKWRDLWVAFHS
jgi:hypothetical protein